MSDKTVFSGEFLGLLNNSKNKTIIHKSISNKPNHESYDKEIDGYEKKDEEDIKPVMQYLELTKKKIETEKLQDEVSFNENFNQESIKENILKDLTDNIHDIPEIISKDQEIKTEDHLVDTNEVIDENVKIVGKYTKEQILDEMVPIQHKYFTTTTLDRYFKLPQQLPSCFKANIKDLYYSIAHFPNGCTKLNQTFANELNVSDRTIHRWLRKLEKQGMIVNNGNSNEYRVLMALDPSQFEAQAQIVANKPPKLIKKRENMAKNAVVQKEPQSIQDILFPQQALKQIEGLATTIHELQQKCEALERQNKEQAQKIEELSMKRAKNEIVANSPSQCIVIPETKNKRFVKPTPDDVRQYCNEKGINDFDADSFCDFYNSKGWMVGKNPMKDWRASVRLWVKNNQEKKQAQNQNRCEDSFDRMLRKNEKIINARFATSEDLWNSLKSKS